MVTHQNQFPLSSLLSGSSAVPHYYTVFPYNISRFYCLCCLCLLQAFQCVSYCHLLATAWSADEISPLHQRKRDLLRPRRRASPSRCSPSSSSPTSPPSFMSPSSSAGRKLEQHAGGRGWVVVKDLQSLSSRVHHLKHFEQILSLLLSWPYDKYIHLP